MITFLGQEMWGPLPLTFLGQEMLSCHVSCIECAGQSKRPLLNRRFGPLRVFLGANSRARCEMFQDSLRAGAKCAALAGPKAVLNALPSPTHFDTSAVGTPR